MAIFEDITLEWKGESYTIKGTDALPIIAKIEDEVFTIFELFEAEKDPRKIKITKVARAFAMALRYAGAKDVSDDEVYKTAIFGNALPSLNALLSLMTPPVDEDEGAPGKQETKEESKIPAEKPE